MSETCQRIRVSGVVQGVGFRPFVWRLAQELQLAGWVRNDALGVEIEACGPQQHVSALIERLQREAPPLARVDAITASSCKMSHGKRGFAIIDSREGQASTIISHDTAICRDCLAELFDPRGRRYRYAFTHCTHCGPRYTLCHNVPYDRARTSMAPFALCKDCRQEYARPADRRFHAEANCCPACGPQLRLLDTEGSALPGDPVAMTLERLQAGQIIAIKGLGGFHLACNARDAEAVARLRARKNRDEKPFAVMVANARSAAALAQIGIGEPALLEAAERPIVLLKKRNGTDPLLPGVAPGLNWLGVMLPCTPQQYLLFHAAAGNPAGTAWLEQAQALCLVMTSANPGGEPLVIDNAEAQTRLAGIADALLVHDRDIVVRCDDSVVRASSSGPQFIRRARGYTPRAIRLPRSGPSVLATGGWFKNTICLTRGNEAFVSQHLGDLDNAATCQFFEETVSHLSALLQVQPQRVAHDLHPDFHSSRFAAAYAAEHGLPLLGVQHHHAHLAAVLAEHGHTGPALGLALDGVGLGLDGGAWGGELLRLDGRDCTRVGHLAPLPLPGSDRAAREPWRMAAAALYCLGRGEEIAARFATQPAAATLVSMLERNLNCPPSSSLGRHFDAVAGLLGIRPVMAYEGQAAMLLEGLAERYGETLPRRDAWALRGTTLDLLPLLAQLADETDPGRGAALFHASLAAACEAWILALRDGCPTIVLSGGCLLNQLFSRQLRSRLAAHGLTVLEARQLPPNDGGLALGQAWLALQTF